MKDDGLCKEVHPYLAHDEDGDMTLWCGLPRGHNGQHEDARAVILELRTQLDAIQKEANMMIEGLFNADVREQALRTQLRTLRAALETAQQSLQWWSYTEHARSHTYNGIPQDPCGTRAALERIAAAIAATADDKENEG